MAVMPKILSARTCGIMRSKNVDVMAYRVGIYQPIARKADGVKTLRLVGNIGPKFDRLKHADEFGEAYAAEHETEYFYFKKANHGTLFDSLPDGVHTYFDFIEAME
jgi:hypothetical protein